MATNVTTTLVVSLKSDAEESSIFSAEVDDRETGLNAGDTSFAPGDAIGYLVYMSSNVDPATLSQIASKGSITAAGTGTKSVTEFIQFANEREATPQYPIYGGFTYAWMGNNLGALTMVNDRALSIAAAGVGVAKVTYNTFYRSFLLSSTLIPGEPEYEILIYIAAQTF